MKSRPAGGAHSSVFAPHANVDLGEGHLTMDIDSIGLSVTLKPGGHKIKREGGDKSFAYLSFRSLLPGFKVVSSEDFEQSYVMEGHKLELTAASESSKKTHSYHIKVTKMGWNGSNAVLEIEVDQSKSKSTSSSSSLPGPPPPFEPPSSFEHKLVAATSKSVTFPAALLELTWVGGGHEIMDDGSDPCFAEVKASCTLANARPIYHSLNLFNGSSHEIDFKVGDLKLSYRIASSDVEWDGESLTIQIDILTPKGLPFSQPQTPKSHFTFSQHVLEKSEEIFGIKFTFKAKLGTNRSAKTESQKYFGDFTIVASPNGAVQEKTFRSHGNESHKVTFMDSARDTIELTCDVGEILYGGHQVDVDVSKAKTRA